jgi:hypothetical protein
MWAGEIALTNTDGEGDRIGVVLDRDARTGGGPEIGRLDWGRIEDVGMRG